MKKFLVVAALVALIATPAFAGLAPRHFSGSNNGLADQEASVDGRGASYVMNDPLHVYDNMQRTVSGAPVAPDDVIYSWGNKNTTSGVNFGASWNRMTMKPGTTALATYMHLRIVTGYEQSSTILPLSIAFYSSVGGANPIGNQLFYAAYGLQNPGAPSLFTYTLPIPNIPIPNRNIWIGFASSMKYTLRGGWEHGTQFDGGPGDALAAAKYIGSGSGIFASAPIFTTSGPGTMVAGFGGLGSAMNARAFRTAFTSGGVPTRYLNNFHVAIGGVPEPTTAVLLALGGLVALRRRKA